MLKPINRLTKTRDFNLVLKHGQWASAGVLTLKWLKLAENRQYFPKKENLDNFEKQLRLAIVVGLKVDKRAVVRNRVKRQIREVCRLLLKADRITGGHYLMFVAKPGIVGKNYAEISQEVELLLRKIKILK